MSAASRKVAGPSQGQEAIHPSHALIPQILVVNKSRQESGPGGWGHTCMLSLRILNQTHTHHTCVAHMHSYTCSYTNSHSWPKARLPTHPHVCVTSLHIHTLCSHISTLTHSRAHTRIYSRAHTLMYSYPRGRVPTATHSQLVCSRAADATSSRES